MPQKSVKTDYSMFDGTVYFRSAAVGVSGAMLAYLIANMATNCFGPYLSLIFYSVSSLVELDGFDPNIFNPMNFVIIYFCPKP